MKTTIDIPDDLYRKAKIAAAESGQTLRDLVLAGLAEHLTPSSAKPSKPPALHDDADIYEMDDLGFLVLKRKYGDTTVITNEFINQLREAEGI